MAQSERLRLSEVQSAYRLVGEVRELGADPAVWSAHLVTGLKKIVGAKVGISVEARGWRAGALRTAPITFTDIGWADPSERARFLEWIGKPESDGPDYAAFAERLAGEDCFTCVRRDLVSDTDWYSSSHLNEFRKVADLDDCLYASTVLPHLNGVFLLALHRTTSDRPFGARDWKLAQMVNSELASLWTPSAPPEAALPPQLRVVLAELLRGSSEKEIARDLGLSPHTVHRHVGRLHRHFGVSTRAELLARCLSKRSAFRPRLALELHR